MNITSDLIKSILTQAEAITCKNLRAEVDGEDIIIRFEDNTDTTISIYYTPARDLIAIGTINSLGDYRNYSRYAGISELDSDTFRKYVALKVVTLVLEHVADKMVL